MMYADGVAGSSEPGPWEPFRVCLQVACMASVSRLSERVGHLAPWFDELEGVAGCVAAYSIPQNAGEYGGGDERIRRLHAFAICSNNHSEL